MNTFYLLFACILAISQTSDASFPYDGFYGGYGLAGHYPYAPFAYGYGYPYGYGLHSHYYHPRAALRNVASSYHKGKIWLALSQQ
ncbi:hypothetical protein ANCCEY_05154 [Ancylostoma ceylanicum]|uniref:Sulfur globule protein CV3 domain protein n=1 Tax=Ancylostoma ceylanicum TaxID=53326 RepID=A0A0D6M046_9BILA|nr:hypothetical protein ANCCEY_05154 [Ancylostoma ceylanicum]